MTTTVIFLPSISLATSSPLGAVLVYRLLNIPRLLYRAWATMRYIGEGQKSLISVSLCSNTVQEFIRTERVVPRQRAPCHSHLSDLQQMGLLAYCMLRQQLDYTKPCPSVLSSATIILREPPISRCTSSLTLQMVSS
ncbi:hypothetical protein BDZ89DRAFT_208524 [Hymenopellis radicata]|nr:hypothetical protein BDZ89DRAFT_208524 [Hymenopellis radicata]